MLSERFVEGQLIGQIAPDTGRFFQHRLKQIQSKSGSVTQFGQMLEAIRKNPVMLTSQLVSSSNPLITKKVSHVRKVSQDLEPTPTKKRPSPFVVHKRANSNIDQLSEMTSSTNKYQLYNLSEEDTAATPVKKEVSSFSILASLSNRKQAIPSIAQKFSNSESEKKIKSSISQSSIFTPGLPGHFGKAGNLKDLKISEQTTSSALKRLESLRQSQGTMPSLPSLSRVPSLEGLHSQGTTSRQASVIKSLNEIQQLPTYFSNTLRRVLIQKSMSTPLERIYYEHFIKNLKDIGSMTKDELLDEEEYLDKVRLRRVLKEEDCAFVLENLPSLPLLVLDLDETLLHCLKDNNHGYAAHETILNLPGKSPITLKFNIRPHAREFLEEMSRHYNIFVYTASEYAYARTLLDAIDPQRLYVKRVFDRRFCCITQKGYVVKDLRIFSREAKIKHMLLVDNSSYCFFPQLKNGIPIIPFENNKQDRELLDLKEYLKYLAKDTSKMVSVNADYFKLHHYAQSRRIEELCQVLF